MASILFLVVNFLFEFREFLIYQLFNPSYQFLFGLHIHTQERTLHDHWRNSL